MEFRKLIIIVILAGFSTLAVLNERLPILEVGVPAFIRLIVNDITNIIGITEVQVTRSIVIMLISSGAVAEENPELSLVKICVFEFARS